MAGQPAIVAVLAGGGGTRIGGQKALASLAGRPLIEYVLGSARDAELETYVVAKRDSALPPAAEPLIGEPDEPRHPLCGVLAALDFAAAQLPARDVLVVPCDMPLLSAALLRLLAGLEGAVVLELDGTMQPLPARLRTSDAASLREALARGSSLRTALLALAPRLLGERELARFGDPARLLQGVNTPEDLRQAEALLAAASGRD
jgi:molybdopterin-guanine dinucleotide biosynthesis protein A